MKRIKGIFRDTNPIDQPDETYLDARNVEINREFGTISSQKGNVSVANITGTIIGHVAISGNRFIVFSKNNALPESSRIGILNPYSPTTTYSDITPVGLDFDFGDYIQARSEIDSKGRDIVYWVDGKNHPRFMDIDNLSTIIDDYDLFPNTLSKTKVSLTDVGDGGSLPTGAYWFAIAYVDEEGTRTDYSTVFGPVYVTRDSERLGGSDTKVATSKRIVLSLSEIDNRYSKIRVAVLSKHDGVIDPVRILSDIPISATEMTFIHTGTETFTPGSIEEIIIDRAKYSKAGAIAIIDDFLYLADLEQETDIGYQKYANGITSTLHTEIIEDAIEFDSFNSMRKTNDKGFSNTVVASSKKGFRLDEVYAFYIDFVLKSGKITKAYHIPGRGPQLISVGETFAQYKFQIGENSLSSQETAKLTFATKESSPFTILSTDTTEQIRDKVLDSLYSSDVSDVAVVSYSGNDILLTWREGGTVGNLKSGFKTVTSPDPVTPGAKAEASIVVQGPIPMDANFFTVSIGTTVPVTILGGETTQQVASLIANAINTDPVLSLIWVAEAIPLSSTVQITALENDASLNGINVTNTASFTITTDITSGGIDDVVRTVNFAFSNTEEAVNGVLTDELSAGDQTEYLFQERSIPGTNGMGFWQNNNETYPNTEDWDIWTVNGSGVGSYSGQTLRNQKVRHHRFPGNEHIENPLMDGTDLKIYSVSFSNIRIPEEIREKAVGFRIHYAKRDELNSLVIDSSVVHASRISSGILRSQALNRGGSGYTVQQDIAYLHPFNLLRTRDRIGNITHVKRHTFLKSSVGSDPSPLYTPSDSRFFMTDLISQRVPSPDRAFLIPIAGISYVESQSTETRISLNKAGITTPIQNQWGQQMVVVKSDGFNLLEPSPHYYAADLISMKEDLYRTFENQLLVDTGYYQEIDGSYNYSTDPVFGGDTFTNIWTYKTACKQSGEDRYHISVNNTITQSSSNIELRGVGDAVYETFYPVKQDVTEAYAMKHENGLPSFNWETGTTNFDNFIRYNRDFSEQNNIKPGFVDFDNEEISVFPSRIIRSQKSKILGTNFRTFLADDYMDLPNSRGRVVRLSVYDSVLIPHLERALIRTRGSEEIKTADFRAFLGTGDIFGVKPEEILYTENGEYGISDSNHALPTPFGYVFVDVKSRKIHMLNGEGMKEISNNGLFNTFQEALSEDAVVRLGYDPSLRRILVTVMNNDTYAYHPELGMWMTTHSFQPNIYMNDDRNLFTNKNNAVWRHGEGFLIYGQQFTCSYKFVENGEKEYTKNLESIRIIMDTTNSGSFSNDFLTNFQITNSHQDTGTVPIVKDAAFGYLSNARKVNNEWHISGFRNLTAGSDAYAWARRQRLYDKYFIINLVFSPGTSKTFKIHDIQPNLSMRSR